MTGFAYIVVIAIAVLVVVALIGKTALGNRIRVTTMATSTNRLLLAIVVMLFAFILKLVSTGMDDLVLLVALVSVVISAYGIIAEPQ